MTSSDYSFNTIHYIVMDNGLCCDT